MNKQPQAVWKFILDTIFPAVCCGCRREGTFLCDSCRKALPLRSDPIFESVEEGMALDGILACCNYEDGSLMSRLIHALKYDFVVDLAKSLGDVMAGCLREQISDDVILCPVPLHPKRLRWRGFNQSMLLAGRVGTITNLPVQHLVQRVHFQKAQMELKKEERAANVHEAFAAVDGLRPDQLSTVILIDDVATTLSTLEACARVLKAGGAQKVLGIVLARVY